MDGGERVGLMSMQLRAGMEVLWGWLWQEDETNKGSTGGQAKRGATVERNQASGVDGCHGIGRTKQDYKTRQRSIGLSCIHPEKDLLRDQVVCC